MATDNRKTVVIVGGGITGLSTAFYLEKSARERGEELRVVVVEASDRLGGKIMTEETDGYVIELGPDSFLARKVAAVNLARDLGIEHELVGQNPNARKTYIYYKNDLHRLPQGLNIGVPTQFMPFATTKLLSIPGKIRAGLDFVLPKSDGKHDQSLGEFLERRLGKEVVTNMCAPLLSGIYAGDLYKLSLRATFPQFEALEQKYGSLVRGMLAQARELKAKAAQAKSGQGSNTPTQPEYGAKPSVKLPNSMFLTFKNGLERYITRLVEVLESTDLRTSTRVQAIDKADRTGTYHVRLEGGETILADAVVVTTPTYDAANLLPDSFKPKAMLEKVPYVSVATVVFAFDKGAFQYDLDASGFLCPRGQGTTITACTWTSSKWLHTASDGKILMRFYVGRAGEEEIVNETDEEIVRRVRQDMKRIMNLTAVPKFTRVTRMREAMPQYTVGHLDRVKAFNEEAAQLLPGVLFTGAGYNGLGIPDCIGHGVNAAAQITAHLTQYRASEEPVPETSK